MSKDVRVRVSLRAPKIPQNYYPNSPTLPYTRGIMAKAKAAHEKTLEEMSFPELLDYWTGYAVMEIGRGHSLRDVINLMLQNTMRVSYERGIKDGKTGKRGGA